MWSGIEAVLTPMFAQDSLLQRCQELGEEVAKAEKVRREQEERRREAEAALQTLQEENQTLGDHLQVHSAQEEDLQAKVRQSVFTVTLYIVHNIGLWIHAAARYGGSAESGDQEVQGRSRNCSRRRKKGQKLF